ncbi:MAG: efflux RND transporter permease subunit [Anaerovibrio sp.]|uniref:efflux RND transporter permease subunit n=1 Tax=Anaerovibrio sp. TaxID=1872532 RepID=UPI0025DC3DBA|nr:efflux RND transporter permease subunit [Anaerovibrio sp.]MCR5175422.1 efflux RND transporter permease subunit [Anaerovibrio sp.]
MINLTEVSLKNRSLVWYFIIMIIIGGVFSYIKLGRMEDPNFTIREMVVTAAWPGATAEQMEEQVTDKLESKINDLPGIDRINSTTRNGTTVIHVILKDSYDGDIRASWRDVRNFCTDIQKELPDGVYGPYFNDRFDDVYGSLYALTGDGYSYEEMRKEAEDIRRMILSNVNDSVQKVELVGVQTQKVYVEIENSKLAQLNINPKALAEALAGQNQMTPSGMIETSTDNVYLRYSGYFENIDDIKNAPVNAGGRIVRLGDIAKVEMRYSEPSDPKMYFNGEPAIGIAVSMEPGKNIITLGEELGNLMKFVNEELPVGLEIHQVSDQPKVVEESIGDFVSTLREAVIIVLTVSFLSLGVRTGMVVACCIPLVLAAVFCGMYMFGIDLQKVSLGALIISLGLLVDDAIIAVEMMSVKLEEGLDRFDAACYAFKATAKPMLTGTLITCAGFIPVAFSKGMAAEFCSALFPVISMALVISWIVSVMVAPLYGYHLIKVKVKKNEAGESTQYQSRFYNIFRNILTWFLTHKKLVLSVTAGLFVLSVIGMKHVREEFFPPSTRPEIIVSMRLNDGASLQNSEEISRRFAEFLDQHADEIENYSYYVGIGAPRFVLTFSPETPTPNYSQFIVVSKDPEHRAELTRKIRNELENNFPEVRHDIKFIQTGPPADYPIMLKVYGNDKDKVIEIGEKVADRIAQDENNTEVHLNWYEKSKVLHLEYDQNKLNAMGLTAQNVSQMVYTELTGITAAQFYHGDRTVDIVMQMEDIERNDISKVKSLPILTGNGYVPLDQVADITLNTENGVISRENLGPCVTVQSNIVSGTANDATEKAMKSIQDIVDNLPPGYRIKAAGALSDSADSMGNLMKPIPVMVFCIMTLLMFQLKNGKHMILTLLTAPLGFIGVVAGMLLFDQAMGFVAILGVLALSGMIIRNSVILIDQIQKHKADGESEWDAVVDSAVMRFRPIMLTAAAAILGMIPLMASSFWGPMAVAIASGLFIATVLTLLVLPTMYAAVYKVEKE